MGPQAASHASEVNHDPDCFRDKRQRCTFGDGNTAEEYEAIAVALLRTAEAIRNGEEGRVECLGRDGKVLASVLIHHCGPECDEEALADPVTIEEVTCVRSSGSSLRAISRSMIDEYRRAARQ